MISLVKIDESNIVKAKKLEVFENQKSFLDSAEGIVKRAEIYKNLNSHLFGIANNETLIGLALVKDFEEEPFAYDLQQFMIDKNFQGRGYGIEALKLILEYLKKEGRFESVEICVKKEDFPAIKLYEKVGFKNSGYIDENLPDCINYIYYL
ncbi:MAG: GNAT family N-acetyltransferase [Oscillospiraceae bacterium]|nr:GNAT family N-acetyltransferase [Oscillospiraceae bacterium]